MTLYYAVAKLENEEEAYLLQIRNEGERRFNDDIEDAVLYKTVEEVPSLLEDEYIVEVSDVMSYEPRSRSVLGKLGSYQRIMDTKSESFWVLRRPTSNKHFPEVKEEFAIECNCNSITLNHLCTVDSPEKANRYDTKEIVEQENFWIGQGFVPVQYKMTLTEIVS